MITHTLGQYDTVIVVTQPERFATLTLFADVAYATRLKLIPAQDSEEALDSIAGHTQCLLVIDAGYPKDKNVEKVVAAGVNHGAHCCSFQSYKAHLLRSADIESMNDLLHWLEVTGSSRKRGLSDRVGCFFARCAAAVLLIATFPLMILIALGIAMSSPGPILFHQARVGHRGRIFQLKKFRTMHTHAERAGPQWSSGDDDPRAFAFGRFLRKTHLDEIPQLWNIVQGDLCFVGPRPERPEFHGILDQEIPHFRSRTRVKPGITGWAQITTGYASSIDDCRRKVAHDLYYISNANSVMKLKIIAGTIVKIIRETVAYLLRGLRSLFTPSAMKD